MSPKKKIILAVLVLFLAALACDYLPTPAPEEPPVDVIATSVAATLAAGDEDPGTPPDDPTPEPPAILKVAYVKDSDVWYWEEGGSPLQLTTSGDVISVWLSDDGSIAAFSRQYSFTEVEIYAVNTDGSGLRALVTLADLVGMKSMRDAISAIPYQVDWKLGTHTLAFNTMMTFEGPGLFLGDDHYLVDTDSAVISTLLAPGDGGDFFYSPDGSQIALSLPEEILVVDADGTNRRSLLTFPFVITYSEFAYYPPVVWSLDSSYLRVAIPPADPLAAPPDPTTIWHLPADGSPASTLATLISAPFRFDSVRFSPGTDQIAYLFEATPGAPPILDLHLSNADGSGDVLYASGDLNFYGWSADGNYFSFSESGFPPQLGRIGDPPLAIPGVASQGRVTWVDETRFLFVTRPGASWELWLRDAAGAGILLDSTTGDYINFDFVH